MIDDLKQRLQPHGQEHLVQFWDELSADERRELAAQLSDLDFAELRELYEGGETDSHADRAQRAEPAPAFRLDGVGNRFSVSEARKRGEQALAAGEVGTILVAGGQGTRLGFDHPKGMFPIGPVSGASLFKILFEKLAAVGERYGQRMPLYLMTSPATHAETETYLAEQNYFGLDRADVRIFCQGTMPAVDAKSGQLLLDEKGHLFVSPDGHGGMLAALAKTGAIDHQQSRGLKQLFYFQVDNPLVEVCDPVFIGYHLLAQSELSTQVVAKQHPTERVGNVVSIDGKVQIIEYSDLPNEVAEQRAPDGSLKLWAGNIAVHVFDVAFLARMAGDAKSLPFHVARKAVPYVCESGEKVTPSEPNAIKFERFIFDLLPMARQAIIMEIDGRRVFAPVKNAPGSKTDTPESVQQQMGDLYREWLTAAGAKVTAAKVEISPRFALDAKAVAERIRAGQVFDRDTYLSAT